ncbi:arginase family protein [Cytobacillus massiliigabonensis]|uniref:arginase family protein n=1 Tax=Cytobacillus massiliigabonensis TaxID=1871011 RepID=UPI000C83E3B8|nr:arginase family protein [Cytobacillus massiliigabonensis]
MLTLNKNIISLKTENHNYHLKNIITGQGIEINQETLEFIRQFELGLTLEDIESKFGLEKEEIEPIVSTLIRLGILNSDSDTNQNEIINDTFFEKKGSNFSFFDSANEPINESQIGLLGISYDGAVTGISGTKLAPNKIRQYTSGYTSTITNIDEVDKTYTLTSSIYNKSLVFDAGNILYVPGESSYSLHNRVKNAYSFLKNTYNNIFFAIGGDHSITAPILESFDTKEVTLVKIDAHYDAVIPYKNQPVNHNNFISKVRDQPNIKQIIHLGVRESLTPSMELLNDKVITAEEIIQNQWVDKLQQYLDVNDNVYISIDVDVLDPSVVQGTGYLLPFGLKLEQLNDLIGYFNQFSIIGLDIVEFNPLLDKNNQTLYAILNIIENTIRQLIKKEAYQ